MTIERLLEHLAVMISRGNPQCDGIPRRGSFPIEVERLARYMSRDFGRRLAAVDEDFGLAATTLAKVQEVRAAQSVQFLRVLKDHMKRRPDLLTFDQKRPEKVWFDAAAAGVGDEILALIREDARTVTDMAAHALKECDFKRHFSRMAAMASEKKGSR